MAAITTAVAVGVTAAVGVAGAIESHRAAKKKERLIESETSELVRLKENEIQQFEGSQRTAFAKSGVLLEGTPLEVLEATRKEGARQKEMIEITGEAQRDLAKSQGRSAILAGIGSVAGGVAGIAKAGA